jgi:preprotein translocase subunit SecD
MKSFIYLLISLVISITLTSSAQKKTESTKTIILQSTGKNTGSEILKQSGDIISSRLKLFGLSSFEVNISADKGQIKVQLPENTDMSEIEGLITARGELSFYETYTHSEIADLFKPDNGLLKFLGNLQEEKPSDPRVGCAGTQNRKEADEYIRSSAHVRNCKLFWGFESEKSGYCLFALKTDDAGRPLLARTDVKSVKIVAGKDTKDVKIQIKLKPAAISVFADATKKNLNRAIAIVIDEKVYSWPVVKSVIEGGEIEVTGSFTLKEVNYFPAIFNSEQLPLILKVLN